MPVARTALQPTLFICLLICSCTAHSPHLIGLSLRPAGLRAGRGQSDGSYVCIRMGVPTAGLTERRFDHGTVPPSPLAIQSVAQPPDASTAWILEHSYVL
eukprot:8226313-Pyramimonas_sp.AAC.1